MPFAHLHVHSQYSLLDGAIPIKKLAPSVAALGQQHVALTDHCNLYGAVSFHKACKAEGVHAIIGSGLWVQPEGIATEDPAGQFGGYHLVVLIEDQQGYQNLCKLITNAIFDGMYYKPRVDLEMLREHRHGLIALTSGLRGPIRAHWAQGRRDLARQQLSGLVDVFGTDNLFVELQDVGFDEDAEANVGCRTLATEFGLQTVVTNNVHYLKASDAPTLDLLQCIGAGTSINDRERRRPVTDQLYLKSEEEIREIFPDDGDAIDRTVEIAERCTFAFDYDTYYFPASTPPDTQDGADTDANWEYFYLAFPPPRDFGLPMIGDQVPPRPEGAGNLNGYFEWYSKRGLELRLERVPEEQHPAYWERLQIEFDIVESMGFPAYFLIVAEFINWAKDQDIPVGPGRGSAAGSLVAYAQRITDIDPIRFDLLFERFLNPERISMPDVDVDFCQDRREEVIEHTRQKYGTEYVAQIITYGKLQAKLAVRDVARVCDLGFNDADRIAKLIPNELGISLDGALMEEGLARLRDGDPRVRRIYDLARSVEGLTRQTGIHAAGVVVADRPLVELVPLYRDGPDGGPVVQFEMKAAESVGLIKFDFLGLKTLDQIRDAVALIERNTGEVIDMSDVDVEDARTYELLCRGDGLGVFQVESSGMRELLTKLRPSCLDDVVALVALYRPGPLNSGMVDDFIDRKHGRKEVTYLFDELIPILDNTYGVVVYQEQVMKIAQVLASYSLGEADLLRRAMGKKKVEEMEKQKIRFMSGAETNGFDPKKAEEIFDLLAMFAAYGFNKSHSAAYGYISYQTAWLKANHRGEYMAALMSIEASNTDKIVVYIGDCRRSKLRILAPSVNESFWYFDVKKDDRRAIRFGLGAIKNVGHAAVEALIDARESAPFTSFIDCLERLDYKRINKKALEMMVKCGAFDEFGVDRGVLFEALESGIGYAQREQADKASGQASLFGGPAASGPKPSFRYPEVSEWSEGRRLGHEREALGFYLSGHPVTTFKAEVDKFASCRISGLITKQADQEVIVAGMPATVRVVRTKRGDKMAFVTLDDETGSVECVFFSDPWARSFRAVGETRPLLVRATIERTAEGVKLMADSCELMADVRERRTKEVRIQLRYDELDKQRLDSLKRILERSVGSCRAKLLVEVPDRSVVHLKLPETLSVMANEELVEEVCAVYKRRGVVSFR